MGVFSEIVSPERREKLSAFFLGPYYPILQAIIIFVGHAFAFETFSFPSVALLASAGALVTGSAKPFIMFAAAFLFQLSPQHSPGYQSGFSDYYFTEWRLPIAIISFLLVGVGVAFLVVKGRLYKEITFKKMPLLLPALGLGAAFLLNGAFSSGWSFADVGFGACQVLIYVALYVFFYASLRRENLSELVRYFAYVSSVITLLLFAEIILPYIRHMGIPAKEEMVFGWGIWNTAGACINALVPMCFLGFIKSERFCWYYLSVGVLGFVGAALTQSRNALLIGAVLFAVCMLVLCFKGRYKKAFRITLVVGALCIFAGALVLRDKVGELMGIFFADNGRFTLWQIGIENFLEAPLFGKGFYSFTSETFVSSAFLPDMAHNTVIQILSAMGIFGLAAYLCYRVLSLMPLIRKPDSTKLLLTLSMSAMLLGGLLDNFVFYFLSPLHYTVALVILQLLGRAEATAGGEDN